MHSEQKTRKLKRRIARYGKGSNQQTLTMISLYHRQPMRDMRCRAADEADPRYSCPWKTMCHGTVIENRCYSTVISKLETAVHRKHWLKWSLLSNGAYLTGECIFFAGDHLQIWRRSATMQKQMAGATFGSNCMQRRGALLWNGKLCSCRRRLPAGTGSSQL